MVTSQLFAVIFQHADLIYVLLCIGKYFISFGDWKCQVLNSFRSLRSLLVET